MNIKVADLMVRDVVSLQSSDSLAMAHDAMKQHDIHAVPVLGPTGKPLGILTSSDLMEHHADDDPVARVMSEGVQTIAPHAEMEEAADLMRTTHVHHLLVTDEGKLVGILSTFDLLKLLDPSRFTIAPVSLRAID